MSTVVDHIAAPCVLRVLRAFCDLAGHEHSPGSEWHVTHIEFCFVSKRLTFDLLDHGLTRTVEIDITDSWGLKIGRMHEWFELLGDLPADEMNQLRSASSSSSAAPPPLTDTELSDFAALVGLLKRHEWEDARAECSRLAHQPRYDGEALQNFAGELEGVAAWLAGEDREAGIWRTIWRSTTGMPGAPSPPAAATAPLVCLISKVRGRAGLPCWRRSSNSRGRERQKVKLSNDNTVAPTFPTRFLQPFPLS